MKGHLHFACAPDREGRTALREQSFRAPFHLSKPHTDAGALVVNVVNPTAGIFDGDELVLDVKAEAGSRLVLTTPSASRIYQSRNGGAAVVRQKVEAGTGSFVEFLPEPLIPHAGSVYDQQTVLTAAGDAEMLFFEWLSPGRVAAGETFQYHRLDWQTDILQQGHLVVRERFFLEPSRPDSLTALTQRFPAAHYLACFWLTTRPFPVEAVEPAGSGADLYLGWSPLPGNGYSIKALGADALTTRKLLARLRQILYEAMGTMPPRTGRL